MGLWCAWDSRSAEGRAAFRQAVNQIGLSAEIWQCEASTHTHLLEKGINVWCPMSLRSLDT